MSRVERRSRTFGSWPRFLEWLADVPVGKTVLRWSADAQILYRKIGPDCFRISTFHGKAMHGK